MAVCLNCSAALIGTGKEFCSHVCSDEYWAMTVEETTTTKETEMAQKTEVIVTLVDDLTGEEFEEGNGETFNFAFEGEKYELDLNSKNAKAFRTAVKKYVEAARVVTGRRSTEPSEASQVREWAQAEGKEVNAKGRIPQALLDEYHAAQQ